MLTAAMLFTWKSNIETDGIVVVLVVGINRLTSSLKERSSKAARSRTKVLFAPLLGNP
jgi:di/tricarboxylate transporter